MLNCIVTSNKYQLLVLRISIIFSSFDSLNPNHCQDSRIESQAEIEIEIRSKTRFAPGFRCTRKSRVDWGIIESIRESRVGWQSGVGWKVDSWVGSREFVGSRGSVGESRIDWGYRVIPLVDCYSMCKSNHLINQLTFH